ncbi:Homeodomain-like protein [Xylaria sp. FL0933]|nr:Homeodomain-like protein [Xylaria sp. FL0933]
MIHASSSAPMYQKSGYNTGTWSAEEDARLRNAVAQHGTRWVIVAGDVATRNGDQCAKRWNEKLNPALNHSPWSPAEDKLLLHLVSVYGRNWKLLTSNYLESRAPLALKNRHSLLMRRMRRENPSKKNSNMNENGATSSNSIPTIPTIANLPEDWILPQDNESIEQQDVMEFGPPSQSSGQIRWTPQKEPQRYPSTGFLTPTSPVSVANSGNSTALELDSLFEATGEQLRQSLEATGEKILPESAGSERNTPAVKYSVTCSRRTLKTLVCSMVDSALSETAPSEDDQITLSLRIHT